MISSPETMSYTRNVMSAIVSLRGLAASNLDAGLRQRGEGGGAGDSGTHLVYNHTHAGGWGCGSAEKKRRRREDAIERLEAVKMKESRQNSTLVRRGAKYGIPDIEVG